MRKLSLAFMAAALLVPFSLTGATSSSSIEAAVDTLIDEDMVEVFGAPIDVADPAEGTVVQGNWCCYVFVYGRWWCIPC